MNDTSKQNNKIVEQINTEVLDNIFTNEKVHMNKSSEIYEFDKFIEDRHGIYSILKELKKDTECNIQDYVFKIEVLLLKYKLKTLNLYDEKDFLVYKYYYKTSKKVSVYYDARIQEDWFKDCLIRTLPNLKNIIIEDETLLPQLSEQNNIEDIKNFYLNLLLVKENLNIQNKLAEKQLKDLKLM